MKGLFINEREFDRIKMFKKRVQGLLFSAIVDYWYCGERINTLPIAAQFVYDDICDNIDKLKTCKKNDEKISKNDNISIKNDEKSERATIHDSADNQQHNHRQDKDKDKYINTKTSAKAESKGTAAGSQEKSDFSREQALPVQVQLEMIEAHEGEWLSMMSQQYRNVDMHRLLNTFVERQRLRGKEEEQRTMTEMKEWIVNWLSKPEGVTTINRLVKERQLAAQRAAQQQQAAQATPDDNIDYAAIAEAHRRQKQLSCRVGLTS